MAAQPTNGGFALYRVSHHAYPPSVLPTGGVPRGQPRGRTRHRLRRLPRRPHRLDQAPEELTTRSTSCRQAASHRGRAGLATPGRATSRSWDSTDVPRPGGRDPTRGTCHTWFSSPVRLGGVGRLRKGRTTAMPVHFTPVARGSRGDATCEWETGIRKEPDAIGIGWFLGNAVGQRPRHRGEVLA